MVSELKMLGLHAIRRNGRSYSGSEKHFNACSENAICSFDPSTITELAMASITCSNVLTISNQKSRDAVISSNRNVFRPSLR